MKCAVVGAGAWGTALASVLADNGHETLIWTYEPDVATSINGTHENRRFLPTVMPILNLRSFSREWR